MKKMALVYIAHDGFSGLYCGVGTIARDFLLSYPKVLERIEKEHPDVEISLYIVTNKYNGSFYAVSKEISDVTLETVGKIKRAHFMELHNNSEGTESYGTIDNWRFASVSAATFVRTLSGQYDKVLAIGVDTPFAQLANVYISTYDSPNVEFIWLPQSTVRIHGYGMSSDPNQQGDSYLGQRFDWERGVINLAAIDKRVRIGYVGEFMRQHLIKDYIARPDVLVEMTNSLHLDRLSKNIRSQEFIADFLKQHSIPTDRPILFSFGRAEPYKGLDIVLDNVDELIKKGYFVLIFAAPYSMDDPYLEELNNRAARHPEDISVLYGMDFTAPHYLMQWHNTRILAILSRAEPFGIIPIESRYYNNLNLTLLVSNRGGLPEQVEDGVDGFVTDLTPDKIKKSLRKVAELSDEEKAKISEAGYNKVIKKYNQVEVNFNLLEQYV